MKEKSLRNYLLIVELLVVVIPFLILFYILYRENFFIKPAQVDFYDAKKNKHRSYYPISEIDFLQICISRPFRLKNTLSIRNRCHCFITRLHLPLLMP